MEMDREKLSLQDRILTKLIRRKQSGAAGACWAHNPEVDGSKPSSASQLFDALHILWPMPLLHFR